MTHAGKQDTVTIDQAALGVEVIHAMTSSQYDLVGGHVSRDSQPLDSIKTVNICQCALVIISPEGEVACVIIAEVKP